jgi:hypothetical protein
MDFGTQESNFFAEAERRAKQDYLREEVLDKDYNPNHFVTFCDTLRGSNVDLWTFDELQQVVKDFKLAFRRGEFDRAHHNPKELPSAGAEYPKPSSEVAGLNSVVTEQISEEALLCSEATQLTSQVPQLSSGEAAHIPELSSEEDGVCEVSAKQSSEISAEDTEENSAEFSAKASADEEIKAESHISEVEMPAQASKLPEQRTRTSEPAKAEVAASDPYDRSFEALDLRASVYRVGCVTAVPSSLSDHLRVEVSDPQVVSDSVFASSYATFKVHTSSFNWTVRRCDSDFQWLRKTLCDLFPGRFVSSRQIPPLPPSVKRHRLAKDTLLKKAMFLGHMMNSILRNPLLRTSRILENFLRERSMKVDKSIHKPTQVSELTSLDGVAVCDLEAASSNSTGEYIALSQSIKHKVKRASADITKAHHDLAAGLNTLAELFSQLEHTQNLMPELRRVNASLSRGLRDTLASLALFEQEKAKRVDEYFTLFYKFNYCELHSLKALLKERDSLSTSLRKAEDKLKTQKAVLWGQGNPWSWDLPPGVDPNLVSQDKDAAFALMLHSKNAKAKDLFGYYNHACREEISRVLWDNTTLENRHFAAYAAAEEEARTAEIKLLRDFRSWLDVIRREH